MKLLLLFLIVAALAAPISAIPASSDASEVFSRVNRKCNKCFGAYYDAAMKCDGDFRSDHCHLEGCRWMCKRYPECSRCDNSCDCKQLPPPDQGMEEDYDA
ncbi:hypothetical protein BS50DRAFT_587240 [Corynespora cassiicola Philippines]|uniref:Uncharacterized protein n=1 Tax=Corynespora cassiicola Philippines TaxID=1448308 RepID=A0A2T2NRF9_CORCC|nr:hypothetical protein BS50DRAFT_587240 [Corynespora cassiicola Philippines]